MKINLKILIISLFVCQMTSAHGRGYHYSYTPPNWLINTTIYIAAIYIGFKAANKSLNHIREKEYFYALPWASALAACVATLAYKISKINWLPALSIIVMIAIWCIFSLGLHAFNSGLNKATQKILKTKSNTPFSDLTERTALITHIGFQTLLTLAIAITVFIIGPLILIYNFFAN